MFAAARDRGPERLHLAMEKAGSQDSRDGFGRVDRQQFRGLPGPCPHFRLERGAKKRRAARFGA